jgi:hypothetical protein
MKLDLTLKGEHGLKVFENSMLRKIFGYKRQELKRTLEKIA